VQGVDESDMVGDHGYSTVRELDPFKAFAIFINNLSWKVLQISENADFTLEILFAIAQQSRETLIDPTTEEKQEPINKFYGEFKKTLIELKRDFGFPEYTKALHDEYVTREKKPMISKKNYARLMESEDEFDIDDEDCEYRGRYSGMC
jgi:hypothetical protein